MSLRTVFLSRLIGLYCIVAALAMFLRGQAIVDVVTSLMRDAPLLFFVGVVTLCAGLAMVLAHNVWSGGAVAVTITVVSWLTLIKGVLFLTLTQEAETAFFMQRLHYQEFFHLYAAISLAFGVYLTYCGFSGKPRQ